eukprot:2734400-Amphidinium_carterae.1
MSEKTFQTSPPSEDSFFIKGYYKLNGHDYNLYAEQRCLGRQRPCAAAEKVAGRHGRCQQTDKGAPPQATLK